MAAQQPQPLQDQHHFLCNQNKLRLSSTPYLFVGENYLPLNVVYNEEIILQVGRRGQPTWLLYILRMMLCGVDQELKDLQLHYIDGQCAG
jgi:hypothetical protein